ncbi:MAG: MarR family transcriptional regulator [Burkholderiales bacterium]|nr:MarR family transcriptional regulator [Burkholderiales bacterium]MDE2432046.1 MarR family transcriptional regulator [Burkholderiales bacterium]
MPSSASDHSADWLALDQQLCFALYSASLAMTKRYKPLLEPLGLTYPQYLAMLVLWETSSVSVNELGKRLGLDSGTLTPLLKRLDAAGLIVRHRDAADERRVLIELTEAGRNLKERAQPIPQAAVCQLGMEMDEISALRESLQNLKNKIR